MRIMNDHSKKNQRNKHGWILLPFSMQHQPRLPVVSAGATQFSPGP
jgi:hypothetical protein